MQLIPVLRCALCMTALGVLAACGGEGAGARDEGKSATPLRIARGVPVRRTPSASRIATANAPVPRTLSLRTGGPSRPDKIPKTGIGGNGYLDYGCTNDALRPSGWSSVFVRAGAAGNGTRANPFGTIGQAIAAAGSNRTVVCVAGGSYVANIDLGMRRNHMLVGGLNSAFTARNALAWPATVTAADLNEHVLRAEAPEELVIDGFVLTGSHDRGIEVTAWDANERITRRNNHVHHNGCTTPTARTDCGVSSGSPASL